MPINTSTKIVSVKEQLDDLQNRFDQMLNDESMSDLIKTTHESLLQDSKFEFKKFADSYTTAQRLSIETEKHLAIQDLNKSVENATTGLYVVSVVPLQRDLIEVNEKLENHILQFKKTMSYMNVICAVSIATAIISLFL
jgi:hypothetical protein